MKRIFLLQTYAIEDCYFYNTFTSDNQLWNVNSGNGTIVYSDNGVTLTGKTSTETDIVLGVTLPDGSYECSYLITEMASSTDGYTQHTIIEDAHFGHSRNGIYARRASVSGDIFNTTTKYNPPCHISISVEGTSSKSVKFYREDVQVGTTLTSINRTKLFMLRSYANGRSLTLKNFKIKPL